MPLFVILVLNTLRKMYKTEFCLNNHTNGRNTNLTVSNVEQQDITTVCDSFTSGVHIFSAGPSNPYLPTINVYIGLALKISDNTIRIVAYKSDSAEKPYYKIKSGGVWEPRWSQ